MYDIEDFYLELTIVSLLSQVTLLKTIITVMCIAINFVSYIHVYWFTGVLFKNKRDG